MRASISEISRSRRVMGSALQLPDLDDGLEQLRVHPVEAGAQQLLSVGEVDVDRGAGDPGLSGDLVHGHVGGAPFAEQSAGHLDHLFAPVVANDLLAGRRRPGGASSGLRRLGRRGAAAGNATGRCLIPLMNWDCRRSTGPSSRSSGIRSRRCSNMTRISSRARLAPRQKCGPPGTEGDVRIRVAGDVESLGIVEDGLVAVGRHVEEHHLRVLLDDPARRA